MRLKTIDLCAGIGGIRQGFKLAADQLSIELINVASAEIDEWACKTYEHLYNENPRNDVTDSKFKEELQALHYDILLAGFPCQAFSSVGLRQGFEDKTKGTIFFDIAKIIKMTRPKVVFLENVQNLLSHDKKATFKTIVDTLDRQLNYQIVGIEYDEKGQPINIQNAFIRNSRNFGIPQNRPRVYVVAFSREYFDVHLPMIPTQTPTHREKPAIYTDLNDVLEKDVEPSFFLSSGYLETLEKHIVRQKEKGYGFGYRIVNESSIKHPIANTILATGGSGRERNLIYDPQNGKNYAGMNIKGKYSPINNKCIRAMTPTEWGRLQGFIGYAFIDKDKVDRFTFPDGLPRNQQYKQFGNSVTIPVIEEMALFVFQQIEKMYQAFSPVEKRIFSMYGNEFLVSRRIYKQLGNTLRSETMDRIFDVVYHFGQNKFRVKELSVYLSITPSRASQLLAQLTVVGCVKKCEDGTYVFPDFISISA